MKPRRNPWLDVEQDVLNPAGSPSRGARYKADIQQQIREMVEDEVPPPESMIRPAAGQMQGRYLDLLDLADAHGAAWTRRLRLYRANHATRDRSVTVRMTSPVFEMLCSLGREGETQADTISRIVKGAWLQEVSDEG